MQMSQSAVSKQSNKTMSVKTPLCSATDRIQQISPLGRAVLGNGSLWFHSVSQDDSGWYVCVASNSLGIRGSQRLNVTVACSYTVLAHVSFHPVFHKPLAGAGVLAAPVAATAGFSWWHRCKKRFYVF